MAFTKLLSSVNLWKVTPWRIVRYCSGGTSECGADAGQPVTGKIIKNDAQNSSDEGSKSALVLGVYEENDKFELTPAAEEINQKSGGKICRYLNELSCELKLGKAFVVTDVLPEFGPVAISSLGKKDPGYNKLEELDETKENVRVAVGAGVRALLDRGAVRVSVDGAGQPHAAAEAAHLAAWRFEEFKSPDKRRPEVQLTLQGANGSEEWETGAVYGGAQNWARYLTDMPANKMTPVDFAQCALDTLCPLGVSLAAHERAWLEAQRMHGVLGAAAASAHEPLLLDAVWRGAASPPVLLAAAGLTYDSGGLCLRPAELQRDGRSAAGAAAVLAAMKILAQLKVPVHVRAVIPLCEHVLGARCLKPGDVLPALNGLHVQVEDTDLETQLLLADALVYGQTLYKPTLVIDVATLTQGAAPATGGGAVAALSNSAHAWAALRAAGARCGDRAWRLPLWHYFRRQLRDDPAVDLRNKGSGTATICKGAAFLQHFVCGDWLHLDTSGVTAGGAVYLREDRASGRPARTLAAFLADAAFADQHADNHPPHHHDDKHHDHHHIHHPGIKPHDHHHAHHHGEKHHDHHHAHHHGEKHHDHHHAHHHGDKHHDHHHIHHHGDKHHDHHHSHHHGEKHDAHQHSDKHHDHHHHAHHHGEKHHDHHHAHHHGEKPAHRPSDIPRE